MAAIKLASTASRTGLSYELIICQNISTMAGRLAPGARVAALDISPTHLTIAVSDRGRRQAAPFGVLARSGSVTDDARALARAITRANATDPSGSFDIAGLVVGAPPNAPAEFSYVDGLLLHGADDEEVIAPFPGLDGILFYSEAEAVARAVTGVEDLVRGVELLPERLETRKFGRFATAMHPRVMANDVVDGRTVRARISASEVLQAVLDDLAVAKPQVME
jgi:hypothetical protein